MGTRFRKSKQILPGVRLNVGKKSASVSIGPKGLKHTISTTGKSHTTVSMPGTGLSYTTSSGGKSGAQQGAVSIPAAQSARPHPKARVWHWPSAFSSDGSAPIGIMSVKSARA